MSDNKQRRVYALVALYFWLKARDEDWTRDLTLTKGENYINASLITQNF